MSCHSWFYKKLSSVSKKTLDDKLTGYINGEKPWYMTTEPDAYANALLELNNEQLEEEKSLLEKHPSISDERRECIESFIEEYSKRDYNYFIECQKELQQKYNGFCEKAKEFQKLGHIDEKNCYELFGFFEGGPSTVIERHGKYYYQLYTDSLFRVRGYPQESFDDVNELIMWLWDYEQNMIEEYLWDEDGNFDKRTGMSDELEEKIRKEWAENDNGMYVEFG